MSVYEQLDGGEEVLDGGLAEPPAELGRISTSRSSASSSGETTKRTSPATTAARICPAGPRGVSDAVRKR